MQSAQIKCKEYSALRAGVQNPVCFFYGFMFPDVHGLRAIYNIRRFPCFADIHALKIRSMDFLQ